MRPLAIAITLFVAACSATREPLQESATPLAFERPCGPERTIELGRATADASVCFAFGPRGGFASWNEGATHLARPLSLDGAPTAPAHPWAMPTERLEYVVARSDGRFVLVANAWDAAGNHPTPMLATVDGAANVVGRWTRLADVDGYRIVAVTGAGTALVAIARREAPHPEARFVDVRLDPTPRVTTAPIDLAPADRVLRPIRVEGAGPLAFLEVAPDDGVVELVSDGRVTRGQIAIEGPIRGVTAAWSGPRIQLGLRHAEGRSTVASFEADGRIHDVHAIEGTVADPRPTSGCATVWSGERSVRGTVDGSIARVVTLDCRR